MSWKIKELWIALFLLSVAGIYGNFIRYSYNNNTTVIDISELSGTFGDWQISKTHTIGDKLLDILKSSQYIYRDYVNSRGERVSFFLSYFRDQKYGAQIHSPRHCLPGSGWKILNKELCTLDINGGELKVIKLLSSNDFENQVIFYWFWTRSGPLTNEYLLKLDLAKNSLLHRPTDACFIRIIVADTSQQQAIQIATDFIASLYPHLLNTLRF